ncbi:MAG: thymidylate synthase [Nanoarchaeota archaeon]|nr:thymidylate synthase [Nanoarchaeota archaeon]MBU1004727.1 thymidylate synthase [Nanoarchaeota archaeon]MBU1945342.1 thymidylate synthase [Nanoarchaeota archaeon]
MKAYLDIVKKILDNGIFKKDRTGVGTIAISGVMFEHDMSDGFPLLTTKSVPLRLVASELEFFLRGISDKKWLQDRDNHIWDEWCSPSIVPYAHDSETKKKMLLERDLGPIYGWQWRHFGAAYKDYKTDYTGQGVDQVKRVVELLKTNPDDRQMIVLAWNPLDVDKVIPPFCHYGFQVTVLDGKLNLMWNQRSVDVALGLPFNIASYGLLLHLLAKETGFKEGKLVGFLGDTHIYSNHVDGLKEQFSRVPKKLPTVKTNNFTSIFNWKYTDSEIIGYEHHPRIKFEIAV